MKFSVQGLGFRVPGSESSERRAQGSGLRAQSEGLRAQSEGLREKSIKNPETLKH